MAGDYTGTVVRIDLVYEGGLRTRAVHGPSGVALATDAPKDNEGKGESFSPTDLLATALGSCMMTIMGIAARRRGVALEGAKVSLEKHMVADPQRRVGRLDVAFDMPAGVGAEDRSVLERAALACPVHKSLSPRIEVAVSFRWA